MFDPRLLPPPPPSQAGEGRTGSIGSFVAILTHLAQSGPPGSSGDADEAERFVRLSFRRVLPWCMAQHFNTRVYAQVRLARAVVCR